MQFAFLLFVCACVRVCVRSKGIVLVAGALVECYRMSELCQRGLPVVSCCSTLECERANTCKREWDCVHVCCA
jgi:hypothetical protein